MVKIVATLITLGVGLLFLLGIVIVNKISNYKKIYKFFNALALSVILGLIIFDIFPEILECFASFNISGKIIYILAYILMGIVFLKLLDTLVPVHTHHHQDNETNHQEHNNHMYHIGLVTSMALIIHNIIEGMAIYSLSLDSLKMGLLMALGVTLHNIPMGIEVSITFKLSKKAKIKKIITYFLLAISSFIGSLIMILFNNISLILIGVFMSITLGMLLYISLFELWPEVKGNLKQKETISGLLIGLGLMVITIFI